MKKALRISMPVLVSFLVFGASAHLAFALPPLFDSIADQVVNEDVSSQNVAITNVSDPESQAVTITAASSNTTLIPNPNVSAVSGGSATLTYTPVADQNGTVTITVIADDGQSENATTTRTFTITVNPVNDTPSFTKGADQSISENSGAQTVASWATSISKGASNESSQTLSFIVTNDNNALFSSQPAISSSGTLTYTSATNVTGVATVTVSLQDNEGGTSATQTFTITVSEDTTPPSMSVSSPAADGSFTSDDTPSFTFSAGDAAIIECKMDSDSFSSCTSPYTASALSEGSHTFTASSSDLAGNGATVSRQLTVDKTAPANQDTVFASSVAKQGGASVSIISSGDATNNVWFAPTGTTNFVAGATMTKAADGVATTILAPADAGDYKLFVIDAAGNISTGSTATLTVDNTSPTAAITYSDSDGIVKSGDTLTITATFSEALADSPVVKIAITGSNSVSAADMTKTDSTHYYYTHTVGAGNGTATVALSIGTDVVGNVITGTPTGGTTFTVDNTAPDAPTTPDLNATSDSGSSDSDNITNSTTPTFTFTAESGSSIKIYDTDGTTIIGTGDPTTGTYVIAVSTLSPGAHSITAKATDVTGNVSAASDALSVTIDTSAPVISALTLSPSSGYAIIDDAITLTITADASGYASSTITVNGVATSDFTDNGDNTYSATYTVNSGDTDRVSGVTPASVVLSDVAGNTNTAFTSVSANTLKVDAHVPTLDSARTTSTTTIDLTFSEDLLGTTVTNSDFSVSGYTLTTPDATEVTPGVVRLTVTTPFGTGDTPAVSYTGMVEDMAGNAAPVAGPITPTDGVTPTLSSVTIASNNASTTLAKVGDTVTVSFTASEGLGGTPVVTIRGNAASVSGSGPYTATYTMQSGDAEGTVPFTINFTDSASNAGIQVTAITSGNSVVFDKTAPTISLNGDADMSITYPGSSYSEPGATADDGSTVNIGGSVGINVGDYTVTYDATDAAGNAASQVSRTVHVTKAPLTVTADDKSKTYGDANPALTATITGFVNGEALGTSGVSGVADVTTTAGVTTGVGAPAITVTLGTLTASNYSFSTFTAGTLTITQKSATVTANNKSKTYGDANPSLDAIVTGDVNGDILNYTLGTTATQFTNAGTSTITVTPGSNPNYNVTPTNGTLTIGKAAANLSSIVPYSVTYDGSPHTATGSAIGVQGETLSGLSLASTTHTNAGNYTGDAWTFTDVTGNYNDASGTVNDGIAQATSSTVVTCPASVTYTGSALTPCTVAVTGAGGLSETPAVNHTVNTNAGLASAAYTYTGDANHTGSSDIKDFTIDKASSTTVITCPATQEYTGSAITPCTVAVTGAGSLNETPAPVHSANTSIGTASASYTYAGDSNHTGSSDSKNFGIVDTTSLAPASLTVDSPTQTTLALSWTNSELNGNYYTIKRSTSPITDSTTFDAATTLGGAPTVANGVQGYVAKNLTASTTYYFAVKMTDTPNANVSTISTANGTTAAAGAVSTDTTAPAAVTNVSLSAGTTPTSQIKLDWSATGDDGTTGIASSYIVKRSTSAITASDFDSATTVFNALSPKSNGSAETLSATGLISGTQYCFAVKVLDEVPNTSSISNSVCLTTSSALPTVTSVSPATGQNDGAVGIAITGTNFVTGTTTVRLTNSDNTFDLTGSYASSTQVTATVPVGAPTGVYGVRVIDDNGTSAVLSSAYTVTAAPTPLPAVTDVVPSTIGTNDSNVDVEIYGTDFTGATGAVLDTTVPTTLTNFTVVSATKITATIPGALAAGTYNVKVTTAAGTNSVSAVQVAAIAPVVINSTTSQDQVTDDPIDMGNTSIIPVQVTLQSDTNNSTLDNNTTINVVIPPATTLTNADGSNYTGNINPPQLVKPTAEIESVAGSNAVVITMGNPEQTINFSNDFVTTVTLETTASTAPIIWYYNPSSGLEIAGKDGTKDGVTYEKGGTVLNTVINGSTYTYTIGLLLDHMSSYVAGVAPTVTDISPAGVSTVRSATVVITGTNFSPGATVKFGSTSVTATINSTTRITIPSVSLNSGSHTVTVTNTDALTGTSATNYQVGSSSSGDAGSGGSGGGGGGGGSSSSVATTVVPTVQGQVLAAATYNFTKFLSLGSRGADVTALQQYLFSAGYSLPSGVTGYFGKETKAAVTAFQKARGISPVGYVGPGTRAELNKGTVATTMTTSEVIPNSTQVAAVASGLSTSQVQSIITLLQVFGVDDATMAKVRAALGG